MSWKSARFSQQEMWFSWQMTFLSNWVVLASEEGRRLFWLATAAFTGDWVVLSSVLALVLLAYHRAVLPSDWASDPGVPASDSRPDVGLAARVGIGLVEVSVPACGTVRVGRAWGGREERGPWEPGGLGRGGHIYTLMGDKIMTSVYISITC